MKVNSSLARAITEKKKQTGGREDMELPGVFKNST